MSVFTRYRAEHFRYGQTLTKTGFRKSVKEGRRILSTISKPENSQKEAFSFMEGAKYPTYKRN